jgi:hypothetical protein
MWVIREVLKVHSIDPEVVTRCCGGYKCTFLPITIAEFAHVSTREYIEEKQLHVTVYCTSNDAN